VELIFLLLLLFVVVFAWLARKLETPYPIVLVVAGLLLGFVPGIPKVSLNPDVVFLIVLPPLLYSAAWLTPWREFKFNLVHHPTDANRTPYSRQFAQSRPAE
jgi:NhaP-type Na+/H+ or K+/H+ antiporter